MEIPQQHEASKVGDTYFQPLEGVANAHNQVQGWDFRIGVTARWKELSNSPTIQQPG